MQRTVENSGSWSQRGIALASAIALGLVWAWPAGADPFRTRSPRPVGARAEAAFVSLFRQGNYPETERLARLATTEEPDEPLGRALLAAMAYTRADWATVKTEAEQTQRAADRLRARDPLRGNLYQAIGQFLEAAYILSEGGLGPLRGTPEAIGKLPQINAALDAATKIDPNDPELNLVRGFLEVLLAQNLPFSDAQAAIAKLQRAAPNYVSQRGLAMGYRLLKQSPQAIAAVDQAIAAAPDNPDLVYLKAQLLAAEGKNRKDVALLTEAVKLYEQVLTRRELLPERVIRHLEKNELRRARREIRRLNGER